MVTMTDQTNNRRSRSVLNPFWVFGIVIALFGFFVIPVSKSLWQASHHTLVLEQRMSVALGGACALLYTLVFLNYLLRKRGVEKLLFLALISLFIAVVALSPFTF